MAPSMAPAVQAIEAETMRRVARRLIPLLMAGYFAAYLDRVNVGFAALTHEQGARSSPRQSSGSAAASSSSATSCSRSPAT